ncbi:CoA pyrophosphatase [Clostridium sp. D2Q-11]|uniref:CoA pyrophosphatase n=1 Tax=Anaeromonas frigoriresistens TaxID=2683708 RepID=A0A942Z6K1_9FIRM|nr:CoA pyrophosphatase [Anaeromonas frigoriresistens]MBS4537667.1 CoA pyrophosphatase [Anaeromonas frigoriresistens]
MKSLNNIINLIKNREAKPLGIHADFSVLIPLIYREGELHILYEVRAHHLSTQPGEISFPGGRVEMGETFLEAAIRETMEELNIERENIEIINQTDYIVMPFNIGIYPFLGIIKGIEFENIRFSIDEVSEIFTVPLKYFLENEPEEHNMAIEPQVGEDFPYHLINNGKAYDWRTGIYPVYFYNYRDYIIWGMTARITKNFIDIIDK